MSSRARGGGDESYRERLIRNVVNKRTQGGTRIGIYGAEVCQVCGRLGTFKGQWGAVGSHREGVFVAIHHRHDISASSAARVARRRYRFCGVCRRKVADGGIAVGRSRLCEDCHRQLRRESEGNDVAEWMSDLSRRRYLQLTCRTNQQLRDWDFEMEAFRLDLEALDSEGADRIRLEASGRERWREALKPLGEVHGIDYPTGEGEAV